MRSLALALLATLVVTLAPPRRASAQRLCGSARECVAEGDRHTRNGNAAAARFDYARACERGSTEGCRESARYAEVGRGGEVDLTTALRLFGRLCEEGDGESCNRLGHMYEEGRGIPADAARALRLFKRGCRLDDALGCANAGRLHLRGAPGVRVDRRVARRLLTAACAERSALGCTLLGELHEAAGAHRAAHGRYQIACEEGSPTACHRLALMYAAGRGVSQDRRGARELLDAQCHRGHVPSCRAAVDLGCEDGDARSCSLHGAWLAAEARRTGASPDVAAAVLTRACDGGSASGCYALGGLRRDLDGAPEQARARLVQACDGGIVGGCLEAARLSSDDPEAARALYGRACDAGESAGCEAIGRSSDTRASDTRASDTRASDTRASDTRASDTRASDTRASDTRASDTRASDTRASDTGASDVSASAPAETAPPAGDAARAAAPSPRPASARATMRDQDATLLLRAGFGGTIWWDTPDGLGGAFALESELGVRLLLDPPSGVTLNPVVGALLSAGDQTAIAFEVGLELGIERGPIFVSYGGRFTAGSLADASFLGLRHGARIELAGFVGLLVAHDVMFSEAQRRAYHGLTIALTVDAGPIIHLAMD